MDPKKEEQKKDEQAKPAELTAPENNVHLGSADAFDNTENPLSRDADNISDERLDELFEK